ncbi:MAG: hypothetical protein KC646_12085 [Candidatus Cloacimonetes bacterium]|nr:hypothetical protein [Candidatus Cloacimonadota bacterium]
MVGIKPKLKYKNTEALKRKKKTRFITVVASSVVVLLIAASIFILYQSYLNADKLISAQTPVKSSKQSAQTKPVKAKVDGKDITFLDNSHNFISMYLPLKNSALLKLQRISLKGEQQKIQNNTLIQLLLRELLKHQNIEFSSKQLSSSIQNIFTYKGTLIIDFSLDTLKVLQGQGLQPIILHYALVNSILENFPTNQVLFLFGGKTPAKDHSIIDYSVRFKLNKDLIKQ